MPSINSANQLGYAVLETTWSTAVAPTSVNAFKMINLVTNPDQVNNQRPDKNGSLSSTIGIPGIKTASFSTSMSLAPNGAAGVAPDIGPLLQAGFGKAPAVAAGVSVTYTLDDLQPSLSIWNYWKPGNASQYVAHGAVVSQMTIDCSQNFAGLEFSGPARWVWDSDQTDADTVGKGGLVSIPPEPASPVTNGNPLTLFKGTAILDGQTILEIRTLRVTANFNRELPTDIIFSGQYAGAPGQDRRDVTFDMNVYDKAGDVPFSALKNKAIKKTPIDIVITIGDTAGHRCVLTLKNVELGAPQTDDAQRNKAITFNGSRANATSGTSKDEISLAFT